MIDPGTQPEGEDYMAYNRRRWGGDGWTQSLRRKGALVGAPFGRKGWVGNGVLVPLSIFFYLPRERHPTADWKVWPNTLRAHQLLRFAPREKEAQLKKACFEAIYEQGENLSDPEVVCRLAAEAGVDVEGFRQVLDTPAAQQDVRRACSQASQRGVRGVPYFVVSGREDARPIGFSGAVDAPQLVEIFGEVL